MIANTDIKSKLTIYSRQGIFNNSNINCNKNIELCIDQFAHSNDDHSIKLFLQLEPDEYFHLNEKIIQEQSNYKHILTFEEDILNNCNNAKLFEFGTTSFENLDYTYPEKKFSLSHVCGSKLHTIGHELRQDILYSQNKINIPIDFYLSNVKTDHHQGHIKCKEINNKFNNPTLGDSKFPLFNSMFSLCVENTIKKYYFSEKLIDCLLYKSLPVYFGCSDIHNYFNIDGFIIFNTIDEFFEKINLLTPQYYNERVGIIEENYQKALYWANYNGRLIEKVESLCRS